MRWRAATITSSSMPDEVAGPEIERIAEIAPHAVLVTDTLANAATAAARERLLAAGFGDVRILVWRLRRFHGHGCGGIKPSQRA